MRLSVCVFFICLHKNSKSYGQILMNFSGNIDSGTINRSLDYGGGPQGCLASLVTYQFTDIRVIKRNDKKCPAL